MIFGRIRGKIVKSILECRGYILTCLRDVYNSILLELQEYEFIISWIHFLQDSSDSFENLNGSKIR